MGERLDQVVDQGLGFLTSIGLDTGAIGVAAAASIEAQQETSTSGCSVGHIERPAVLPSPPLDEATVELMRDHTSNEVQGGLTLRAMLAGGVAEDVMEQLAAVSETFHSSWPDPLQHPRCSQHCLTAVSCVPSDAAIMTKLCLDPRRTTRQGVSLAASPNGGAAWDGPVPSRKLGKYDAAIEHRPYGEKAGPVANGYDSRRQYVAEGDDDLSSLGANAPCDWCRARLLSCSRKMLFRTRETQQNRTFRDRRAARQKARPSIRDLADRLCHCGLSCELHFADRYLASLRQMYDAETTAAGQRRVVDTIFLARKPCAGFLGDWLGIGWRGWRKACQRLVGLIVEKPHGLVQYRAHTPPANSTERGTVDKVRAILLENAHMNPETQSMRFFNYDVNGRHALWRVLNENLPDARRLPLTTFRNLLETILAEEGCCALHRMCKDHNKVGIADPSRRAGSVSPNPFFCAHLLPFSLCPTLLVFVWPRAVLLLSAL